ncbi:cell wall-binding protein [Clostridium sp. Marseille-P2415]|uniref:cell wall-binding protein n=1 Tax=Clostridium sp. Marseille-P2415 TaxID=1805471 RepID=UPI0009883917|nr:cell wall-binding protein [Clostridium sp. Marseille-P2415]
MRKQTKLVAVLSTAALLALGASMSSFAATGWQEENGTWVYYNKSGDLETEKWAKSGDNWFYLNEDGEMATDYLVEDDDNYYYVDENGAMVTNKWVSMENEDYDGDDEDEPMNHWYYFGSNGKAYKSSSTGSNASFKSINGKKYIFDDEGKMLYGWIDDNGERVTGDDDWREGIYYCGDENDGAQRTGQWEYLDITDNNYDDTDRGVSSDNLFDDEEQTRYFYFKTNGKKMVDEKGKTINGKKYSFDEDGRMNAEWVNWEASPSTTVASAGTATDSNSTQGSKKYTEGYRYYGSPEDGARVTKGWFQVVPDSYLSVEDYNDDESNWYYSDKDGKLVASEIKTINGKKYAFDSYGVMQDGLVAIKFEGNSTTDIEDVQGDDDLANYHFDTEDEFKDNVSELYTVANYKLYYFGDEDDGAMKTGKQNVEIDGDSFSFLFNKSGSTKGQGKFGVDDDKYYLGGMLMKADKDDKYSVVKTVKSAEGYEEIKLLTTEEFLEDVDATSSIPEGKADDYDEYYDVKAAAKDHADDKGNQIEYRLVNTAGNVQKSKSKAKDGDDRCYKVNSSKEIEAVFVED